MTQEGTFEYPDKVGKQEEPLTKTVKNIDKNKVKKVEPKATAAADQPKPQPVDWRQAFYDVCEAIESNALQTQLMCKNLKTKLIAQEKGLKTQEVPIG